MSHIVCYLWSFFDKRKVNELTLIDFPMLFVGMTTEKGYGFLRCSLLACERGAHPPNDHRGELFTTEPRLSLVNTHICSGFIAHL